MKEPELKERGKKAAREETAHQVTSWKPRRLRKERDWKHQLDLLEKQNQNHLTPLIPLSPKIYNQEQLCSAHKEMGISEYFTTFERLCAAHVIPDDKKVPNLIAKLAGKALNVLQWNANSGCFRLL